MEGRTSRKPWPCKPRQLGLRIGLQAHKKAKAHSLIKWCPFHVGAENRGRGAVERWRESSLCISRRFLLGISRRKCPAALLSQPSDLPKRWKSVASTIACSFTTVAVRHRGYGLRLLNARNLGRASLSIEVRPVPWTDLPEMESSEFPNSGQKPGAVAQSVIPIARETGSRGSQV